MGRVKYIATLTLLEEPMLVEMTSDVPSNEQEVSATHPAPD